MSLANGAGRRERKDMRRNLERVLQAAHELFAERGEGVTMGEVARRAGVGVATIYRSFSSKEDLFAAVSRAACSDARHDLLHAARCADDPLERLNALVLIQLRRNEREAALIDLRPDDDTFPHNCAATPEQAGLYDALHMLIQQAISDGQVRGQLCSGDPVVLAAFCVELLSPRAYHHLKGSAGSTEALAGHIFHFMLRGLGSCEPQ